MLLAQSIIVVHVPSWFPGAQFKRDAEVWKSKMEAFVNEPYDFTKQQMVRRQAAPASKACRRVFMLMPLLLRVL